MGTYSNIDIEFNDGRHEAYCVKGGGPLEVGSSLAAAPFWILKDGVLKAPDEKAVVRYITDEMYGWPASPRTLYDHGFFLDLSDFSNCWFEAGTSEDDEEPRKFPFTFLCAYNFFNGTVNETVVSYLELARQRKNPESSGSGRGVSGNPDAKPERKISQIASEQKSDPMVKWAVRYFEIAELVSFWSKDPSNKVGAIIVGDKGQIIAQGYNGFPRGVKDLEERYNDRETKCKFEVHAEMNAILNALYNGSSVVGASIYIHNHPVCQECAKAIIQSGISKVYIDTEIEEKWTEAWAFSRTMFSEAGVEVCRLSGDRKALILI